LTLVPGNLIAVSKLCFNSQNARDAFGREWRLQNIKFEISPGGSSCNVDFYTPQAQKSKGASSDSSEGGESSDGVSSKNIDGCKVLDVPYLSQRDNPVDSHRTCNVTSLSMMLKALGISDDSPDDIRQGMLAQGLSITSLSNLTTYANSAYDANFSFETAPTIQKVRDTIDAGKPMVMGAYYTSGDHICTIIGYCGEKSLVFHDPWGDWNTDYSDHNGNTVKYSLSDLATIAYTDGDAHTIFPPT
jgi:uncharacterized protein YvpB